MEWVGRVVKWTRVLVAHFSFLVAAVPRSGISQVIMWALTGRNLNCQPNQVKLVAIGTYTRRVRKSVVFSVSVFLFLVGLCLLLAMTRLPLLYLSFLAPSTAVPMSLTRP